MVQYVVYGQAVRYGVEWSTVAGRVKERGLGVGCLVCRDTA